MATRPRMTAHEVLRLLRRKVYRVDLQTGVVTRDGRVITPFVKPSGRKLIRLYFGGRVKAVHLSKLVWMAGAKCVVPAGFEVHHFDEQNDNDGFGNLLCLHKLDHRKMHASQPAAATEEEVPF